MKKSIKTKKISNKFKHELGFVNLAALEVAESQGELEVIDNVGFCNFHHRKDSQTTIYEIAVLPERQKEGWGRLLFYRVLSSAIEHKKAKIIAKCPVDLESNGFYKSLGFKLIEVESGKKRKLNIYEYNIESPLLFYCADGGRNTYSQIAKEEGWLLGLRSDQYDKIPHCPMIDNHWKKYDHFKHLELIKKHKPLIATALDIEFINQYHEILSMAEEISKYCGRVILIPKCEVDLSIVKFPFWLGFSVPSKYGGCKLPVSFFKDYPTHLLGGAPTKQSNFAKYMHIVSLDGNYAQNIARFGKTVYVGCDAGKKITRGNYQSFRLSLKKQKQFWHSTWKWEDEPLGRLM